jgi:hypothetical protein
MKQVHFFALRDDFIPVIEAIEASVQLKYARTGNFQKPEVEEYLDALNIPNLGVADSGSAITGAHYLVCKRDTPVRTRSFALKDGSARFGVDQLRNPDSVILTPAGRWKDDIILGGRVATVSDSMPAQELMKLFNGAMRKQFTKVRAFYVGPHALTWLHSGKRLTISDQSPHEFDLKPAV